MDTEEFDIFEEREKRFQELVGVTIPRLHAGPVQLIRDMVYLFQGQFLLKISPAEQPIYILSNPADGFVYQNALQELQAAAIVAGGTVKSTNAIAFSAAERFGLDTENLQQPVATLSGGESVKLSLAKAHLLKAITKRMVISSPLTWLSSENRHLFDLLVADFGSDARITLLNMTGENDPVGPTLGTSSPTEDESVRFTISLEDVSVELSEATAEHKISRSASLSNWTETFQSPCLMLGENGSGKSLLCKILSRSVFYSGKVKVRSAGSAGRARLIFQDAISQTMARDSDLLLHEPCCSVDQEAKKYYARLVDALRSELIRISTRGLDEEGPALVEHLQEMSLLVAKLNLIAHRLSKRPPLIILDEPDWGIARDVAIALVLATTKVAHENHIALIVVSHKPWWRTICNSILRVTRTEEAGVLAGGHSFRVSMTRELS